MTTQAPRDPIGAALVIGGGIAGIQAALDLANNGIRVTLVEKSPAIGGRMAQLDKTFPTNDCAMCIISPKLVECGQHPNIDLLTTAELVSLEGEAGHFTATVLHRPRYIDLDKCTSCGDCEEVCPIQVLSAFNEGLSEQSAISRPYPQAVPNAYVIAKRGTSPCKNTCPADTSAQGYIALIAAGRYEDALEVIKQYNPFPATVGRVCHHPCESECNRGKLDEPVAICALKRFVADTVYARWDAEGRGEREDRELTPFAWAPSELPPEGKRRVAVVGAGPAGLTAAYFSARMGYQVTVYEALPVAGGMMRVGIPAYRLPREVLNREIDEILSLGVELELDSPVRDINHLFDQGFAAVFLAIGAHEPQKLGIPGEDVAGVFHGVPFLRAVSLGEDVALGERVVVVGGGNTAIDTARTALRIGSREVTIAYRRSQAEMPANEWEIEEAVDEGVRLELLAQPVEVLSDNGHIRGVRCIRMRLGEPDASGRRRPIPIEGSEFVVECNAMVAAVAQAPEISFLDPGHGLEITRWGTFAVDEQTLATNRPGVFAGGDAAAGPGALIEAIAAGRRGALSIDRYLRGVPLLTPRELLPLPVAEWTDEELAEIMTQGGVNPGPRQIAPTAPAEERIGDFREVEQSLTEEQALAEALRCLRCGLCSECYQCVLACKLDAIDHQQAPYEEDLEVGAVVLAPGYSLFDARRAEELGYGRYPNVVTSMEYERLLSASGPTGGHVVRPSDHQVTKKIAFLQCVGSRDQEHDYCSSVCCMYATKEAMLTLEHVPGVHCEIYQMDMRAFGKGFDAYYRRAQELGIGYTRCRASRLFEDPKTKDVIIRYQDEETGELREEAYGLVVLSVGFEPPGDAETLSQTLSIDLNEYGFCWRAPGNPVETSRPGVYVCGAFAEPKDIPDSVVEASGAAAGALRVIGTARGTLVTEKEYPAELDVAAEEPRIGVFICSCGSNIAGVVDVAEVVAHAQTLPGVVHAENTLYTCSADSLKLIQERVAEYNLNRVVVSSCTPRTHEPLFQDTIRSAGLNPYLFEMANIRDQCSWVHSKEPESATLKSEALTRMAVARAWTLEPLHKERQPLDHSALVIGGGVAGMTAALSLADQGYDVTLVEREPVLGGRLRSIHYAAEGGDPQAYLQTLVEQVQADEHIEVLLGYQVVKYAGYVGNFRATVAAVDDPTQRLIPHGVAIVATGGQEYRPSAYLLGEHPGVMTQGDLEEQLATFNLQPFGYAQDKPPTSNLQTVVMIQCVGPWDDDPEVDFYCSRVCCTVAVKNALKIKDLRPDAEVYVLYRDMRTYGFKEALYTEARRRGVIFIRWDDAHRPSIETVDGQLQVRVQELNLGAELVIEPDVVALSSALVPGEGSEKLAKLMKFSCAKEGFFLEAHVKLRPVDFPSEGIFLCGVAHYPKFVDEAVAQAQAAAARAATILSQDMLDVGGVVAVVEPEKCTACLTCVRVCPFEVPVIDHEKAGAGGILGAAVIAAAACQGCGICVSECPAKAIQLQHYRDEQIICKTEALLVPAWVSQ